MEPSSSDTGFFQELPELKNQFYDDVSFQRILKLFVSPALRREVEPELAQLGADVLSPRIFDYVSDAERNLPYLRGSGRSALGRPTSELVTGEGWRGLQSFGIERGIVAYNYTTDHGAHSRLLQMMRCHLWEASAACTTCPGAMTDGAARLLQRHLATRALEPTQRRVFQRAYDRLTSRDPARAWTSGQWMTERPGGSDVSQTETVATFLGDGGRNSEEDDVDADGLPLGPWEINGFKWFSSATDAGMTILLARTSPDKGLSAFYAPMRRRRRRSSPATSMRLSDTIPETELNGVRIQRLKDKFGTRPVPTAELELKGMRAWMVGQEGNGIREIATVLAITRVHCAINCLGLAGRALGAAKAYARVRTISGGPGGGRERVALYRSPLHMQTLADLTGDYHGMMLLTLYTAYVMGVEERQASSREGAQQQDRPEETLLARLHPPPGLATPLLRALSSLHKAYVCKQAVPLLHAACMEALGGVGYLVNAETEPLNLARLFRDGCVNAIWEGTTDVLATDLVRTLAAPSPASKDRPSSLAALEWLVTELTARAAAATTTTTTRNDPGAILRQRWADVRGKIEAGARDAAGAAMLLADARSILFAAAEILIAGFMLADAASDAAPAAAAMCRRFLAKNGFLAGSEDATANSASVQERLASDTAIVYGGNGLADVQHTPAAKL